MSQKRKGTQKFGLWLREKRQTARLTQTEVAKLAGISPSYVSTLERGEPHSVSKIPVKPERETVLAIAKAIGGNPNEALVLAGYMPNHLSDIPDSIRIIGFEELNEEDVDAIVDFIKWKKQSKKRKAQ